MEQHRPEKTDTFGRNLKADLELIRRVNDLNDDRSDEIFALFMLCAAAVFIIAAAVLATICFCETL